jgi:ribosomal-protein-alanine N-acetyltransferase
MNAPAQIETARLVLTTPVMSDAAAIFERYASDAEVTRFVGWPRHRSVVDTEQFLEFSASEWRRWPAGPYLVSSRADGRLLGSTGLAFEAPGHALTGYVLSRDAWGFGYATEALRAMIDVARGIGVVRLSALCHPQHHPSSHVLEKCGFTRDTSQARQAEFPNLAPGVIQDVNCFVITLAAAPR